LREYNNIKIIGDSQSSVGIVSCVFDGYSPDNIGNVINDRGVAVRTGLHCAPDAHKFLGTFGAGTVRLSVNSFTTQDDFQRLKAALNYIHDTQ